MLSSQLKKLEEFGLIPKKIYAEIPPKTEYSITRDGKKAIPVIENIRAYGLMLMKQNNIEANNKGEKKACRGKA